MKHAGVKIHTTGQLPQPLLLSASVHQPQVTVQCKFRTKCGGAPIKKRDFGIQFISTLNGEEKQMHWSCLKCGRMVLLKHLNNLSRCQGWVVDALNKASQIEYATTKQVKEWTLNKAKFVKVAERDESE